MKHLFLTGFILISLTTVAQSERTYFFKFKEKSDSASVAKLTIVSDTFFRYYTKIGKISFNDSGKCILNDNTYQLISFGKPGKRKFNNTKLNVLKNHWLQIRVNDCMSLEISDFGGFFIPEKKVTNTSVAVWDTNFVKATIEKMEITPYYLFPDPWYKILVDMEAFWIKNHFLNILSTFNIKLDCGNCTRVYIDAVLYIGGDGKVMDHEIIDERVCGGTVIKGLAKKMIEYFLIQTYPEGTRGKGILFVIGNGLKC